MSQGSFFFSDLNIALALLCVLGVLYGRGRVLAKFIACIGFLLAMSGHFTYYLQYFADYHRAIMPYADTIYFVRDHIQRYVGSAGWILIALAIILLLRTGEEQSVRSNNHDS